ncbi:Cationic peroxidase SPC4 [Dichanthelium oligosanthes]|uniref:Peroxidase n=1 Tax=Dichanthelium oligosanthes TaxID=888268 RepID=A0A1E5V639_9POAL|nr:Cationic peroxidase SPC4 [Dichanthelium oligosanthes]
MHTVREASVLLKGGKTEQTMGPNTTLQHRALQVIEDIRAKVHAACGPTVSCADITVLATRDVVVTSGGPSYAVALGQRDRVAPASEDDVNALPSPFTASVPDLLRVFQSRGISDAGDLVALSGAHTIGRGICPFFQDRTDNPGGDAFVLKLKADCDRDPNRLQQLDVITSDAFNNAYYRALNTSRGVFTLDMALIRDARTTPIVRRFAQRKDAFFAQFARSIVKLSKVPRKPAGNVGEIRHRSCFRTNAGQSILVADSDFEAIIYILVKSRWPTPVPSPAGIRSHHPIEPPNVSSLPADEIAAGVPLLGRRCWRGRGGSSSSSGSGLFVLAKAFAVGVVLAMEFVHMLHDADEALTNPCLPAVPWRQFPFSGFVAMLAALGTLVIDFVGTHMYERKHRRKEE